MLSTVERERLERRLSGEFCAAFTGTQRVDLEKECIDSGYGCLIIMRREAGRQTCNQPPPLKSVHTKSAVLGFAPFARLIAETLYSILCVACIGTTTSWMPLQSPEADSNCCRRTSRPRSESCNRRLLVRR